MLSVLGCDRGAAASHADAAVRADDAGPPQPLLDHLHWRFYDRHDDPLASHQPATIDCGIAGFYNEPLGLEVDTGKCNYPLAEHPAQLAVAKGDTLRIELYHFDLIAPEPADTHLAILFGDAIQWETHVPIPHPAEHLEARFVATRALALGDPIRLHLHNHGQNTWLLVTIERLAGPRL